MTSLRRRLLWLVLSVSAFAPVLATSCGDSAQEDGMGGLGGKSEGSGGVPTHDGSGGAGSGIVDPLGGSGGEGGSNDGSGGVDAAGGGSAGSGSAGPGSGGSDDGSGGVDAAGGGSEDSSGGSGSGGGPAALSVEEIVAGDLLITEIMVDPEAQTDTFGEWFEIQNTSNSPIDLAGLTLQDGTGSTDVGESLVLAPGAYLALARSADTLGPGLEPGFVYGALAFANAGDVVRLTVGLLTIDEVVYDTNFPIKPGRSLRLAPGIDFLGNDGPGPWCPSGSLYPTGDLGTPGAANGPCLLEASELLPGDLFVTEIMANPAVVSDATGEWFEIYNPTDSAIDLMGLEIADLGTESTLVSALTLVPPDGFAVLGLAGAPSEAEVSTGGRALDYGYTGFILTNTEDEVILRVNATTIDAVTYTAGVPTGASWSLSSAAWDAVSNDTALNWCAATTVTSGDLGTAGAMNPLCLP